MEDKENRIAAYRALVPEEALDISDALGTDWVFRGQASDEWPISSSLERECGRLYKSEPNYPDRKKWFDLLIYSEFETITLAKIKSAPVDVQRDDIPEHDSYSWLALLQHHGCKTRLVDFTESFRIALYFAVREMPDSDAAVWAIRKSALGAKIRSLSDRSGSDLTEEEMSRIQVSRSISWPDGYANEWSLALAYGKPERSNERMTKQEGLFVIPLNVNRLFRENLSKGLGVDWETLNEIDNWDAFREAAQTAIVLKIIIPRDEHNRLLSDLAKMGISEAALFPGLDGFARSLNRYILEPE